MYVKYLMAAFLVVFALSMLFQFTACLLNSMADIDENHPMMRLLGGTSMELVFLALLFVLMIYALVQVFQ